MKTKRNAVQGRLFALFDYQRIAENPRLAKMIEDSAAGETDIPQKKSKGGKEKR